MLLLALSLAASAADTATITRRLEETSSLRASLRDTAKPAVPAEAYVAAASGSVPTGVVSASSSANKKAWGVAVVDVPIGRMWAAINDDPNKVEWTALDHLALLGGSYCQSGRTVFQFLPVPMLTDRWWVVNVRYNDTIHSQSGGRMREQSWRSATPPALPAETQSWADQGIPINSTQGSWVLIDLDGSSTLVEYYTWTDPGGSLPTSVANSFAASGIEDTIRTMTKLAKHGPSCPVY